MHFKLIIISLAIIAATVALLTVTLGAKGRDIFFLVLGYFAFGWTVPDIVKELGRRYFNKS